MLHAGQLLAGRYRIVARLGGGGMGEVYRADDLTLGTAVALKFLPAGALARPGWHERFRSEVRLTRQISHPNVCRVYDIVEEHGRVFLSMEFIDGEDLSSLIRRIGRLPQDKAVEIARQICFGLAAAHETGVIHRDLKPANIMLDGRGVARVMDFGVAGLAVELNQSGAVAAGTPAYMAPEQLEGREVSRRSDLYSLGLVLYEVFTGKPAYKADSLADLRALRSSATRPTSPTQLVDGLDPAVERIILRCLEHDPSARPASAVAVAAGLPGGDPLAAAIAAGETPSPELVAASGEEGTLAPRVAIAAAAAAIVLLIAIVVLRDRLSILRYAPLENSAEVLASKARGVERALGYQEGSRATACGFQVRTALLAAIEEEDKSARRWEKLLDPALTPLSFWYRSSRSSLRPENWWRIATGVDDPPVSRPGETSLVLDARQGGLRYFSHVEPSRPAPPSPRDGAPIPAGAAPGPGAPAAGPGAEPGTSTTDLLAGQMGIAAGSMLPAAPQVLHPVPTDARQAYTTTLPGDVPVPVSVEVGLARGRIAALEVLYPWSYLSSGDDGGSIAQQIAGIGGAFIQVSLLIAGAVLARANFRRNRADRRGALRLACFSFAIVFAASQLMANWTVAPVENFFGVTLVRAVYFSFMWWMFYMAIEPMLRRLWPHLIIAWARLLEGRWRDPLVGRDVLWGMLAGLAVLLLQEPAVGLTAMLIGDPPPRPLSPSVEALTSGRFALAISLDALRNAIAGTLLVSLGLVVLRVFTRRTVGAGALLLVILYIYAQVGPYQGEPGRYVLGALWAGLLTFVFTRLGVLSAAAMVSTAFVLMRIPATIDPSSWYAASGLPVVLVLGGLALLAARIAIGRRAVFSRPILDA